MARSIVTKIETNSGFLENAPISLSPGLNCIIGARGTCKSTLVESLRFALDGNSKRIDEITSPDGIITRTLGAGSVRCFIERQTETGTERYTVDRELGVAPRVSRLDDGASALDPVIGDIEIYSQGALQEIARSNAPHLRLDLIDRPNRPNISRRLRDIETATHELRSLGERFRALRFEIEKRQLQLRDLSQLQEDLGRTIETRPAVSPALGEQHQAYLRRRRALNFLSDLQKLQREAVERLDVLSYAANELDALRARAREETDEPAVEQQAQVLQNALEQLHHAADALSAIDVGAELGRLAAAYEALDQRYLEIRQAAQSVTESLKREDALRQRLGELQKAARDLATMIAERDDVLQRRTRLRYELSRLREEIFDVRVAETDRINRDFGDVVVLTMRRASHSVAYISRLTELLAGSRIRGQDDIARELALNYGYAELLNLIELGDAATIAQTLGRDLGQITRAVSYLRDHPELYDLEAASSEDTLEITLFDQGEPKHVEQLSEGQRATALLPLILRSADCPLVVDQPEDDLDNSFIFEVLVRRINDLKNTRQLIFVTHNANIPVLGDADCVIVMHMQSATKAGAPRIGNVDERKEDILHLLEGGREAFERREERYSSLG